MSTELLGPARIAGDLSQGVFDVLLRTIAEPGTVRRLPTGLDPRIPTTAWLLLALADVAVPVHADDPELEALITAATGATAVPAAEAQLVVLHDAAGLASAGLAAGTALAPEDGARVALPAERLVDHGSDVDPADWALRGPGIRDRRTVTIDGVDTDVVRRLGRASGPPPTGFDTWLFTPLGEVMAIPRTTQIARDAEAEAEADHTMERS